MKGEPASARAPQPGRGRGGELSARVRQRLCAPRTASRPLTSAGPRAGPPGQGGVGDGGGARAGNRVSRRRRARAHSPPPSAPGPAAP